MAECYPRNATECGVSHGGDANLWTGALIWEAYPRAVPGRSRRRGRAVVPFKGLAFGRPRACLFSPRGTQTARPHSQATWRKATPMRLLAASKGILLEVSAVLQWHQEQAWCPRPPSRSSFYLGDRRVPYCWTRSWSEAPGRKRSDAAAVTQRVMSRIPPIGKDECLCKQRLEMKNVCRKKATGGGGG